MNGEAFHDAMNYLDQELIDGVDALRRREKVKRPVFRALIPAACICIALLGAIAMLPRMWKLTSAENAGGDHMYDAENGMAAGGSSMEHSESFVTENEVGCEYGYARMTVYLPYGWEYEVREYHPENHSFGIDFWPEGYSGKVSVNFYESFGVCGTGLVQEEITLAGEAAWMGTYDNRAVWDFISFKYLPGNYVVMTEGVDDWWDTHGSEAMEILDNMVLAEGIMTRDQAIEIALESYDGEYDDIRTSFDFQEGSWYVEFRKDGTNTFGVEVLLDE